MEHLNYHHLRYFREVARLGHLTQAAEKLNVSQSALSTQIRTLEARLGHALFERQGRRLSLTEVGRITLDYADRIFDTGAELLATLNRAGTQRDALRVGALSTLSRNFQIQFLAPLLAADQDLVLRSGSTERLMNDLKALALDVVLTTEPPPSGLEGGFVAHSLAEQPVSIQACPARLNHPDLKRLLAQEPVILPTESSIRSGFDALVSRLQITPRIVADVDDMAMVRLLTREGLGLAIAPAVVFADEIARGVVQTAPFDLGLVERFFAVTVRRSFPHPMLETVLEASRQRPSAEHGHLGH